MYKEENVYNVLDKLGINYIEIKHRAVYTIEEVNQLNITIPGMGIKNLFLRNKKGNEHYLVIVEDSKSVDLKQLSMKIGTTSLSFASQERLEKYLNLTPGAVTPFGLINDTENKVKVILDNDIQKSNQLGFHPNTNTATIVINYQDFEKYLQWSQNEYTFIEI